MDKNQKKIGMKERDRWRLTREKPGDCHERERAVRDKNHMRESRTWLWKED